MARSTVAALETFIVSIPRDVPYLGPLGPGETVNAKGYFVRRGNRTIYPTTDMSVIVKVTAEDGTVGWGETYGIVAPRAVTAIIDDVFAPVVVGRDGRDPAVIKEDLYDLMRVRGFGGGYYGDAIAGVDIALWDLASKVAGLPLAKMLGGQRTDRLPAYVSGLPRATLAERVALAREWVGKGFDAVKYAAVVSHEGIVAEMRALREALGPDVKLMVDLHWKFTAAQAIQLAAELAPYRPTFIEAPVAPEDVDGLAQVAARSAVPVAAGEEWRTVHEVLPRLTRGAVSVLQPEMGHTGVTNFMAIARLAVAFHAELMPHASIGVGIFQAASLHAAATLPNVPYHEYQHSIFDKNLRFVKTTMRCEGGQYHVPEGAGHGVEPVAELWQYVLK
ncbi:MAG: mandelate racemase/muconate lactonizing enzyme family protein [Burkholderiales bacterium]